ncbi:MAG: hypothetical protein HYV36_03065 [Lentisphaerae bacterium]|nr:hypothetical protein [Lentisphaerota bacterium]
MASISEWFVREYFEQQGYLVMQPCKYSVTGRPKRLDEEIDLIVEHPLITEQRLPPTMLWTAADLKTVARAVVGVAGWHSERVYPAMLEQIPELVRFAQAEALRLAARRLGQQNFAKILCLPKLPVSEKLRNDTLRLLKQKGIDGVMEFRTILLELLESVDINKNYEKSDLLQILRLLKNYDLLKPRQLELFAGRNG